MGSRRIFLKNGSLLTAGMIAGSPSLLPGTTCAGFTIQQVIDMILREIPGAPFAQTVDTIKTGDTGRQVTGIVTTMFATIEVIRKTAELGANFIIAHEPTFYNHADDTGWLENDDVYRFKKQLLDRHQITVWRNHDYIHSHRPDGVMTGVLQTLEWQSYQSLTNPAVLVIPPVTLELAIDHCKTRLGISRIQYIGTPDQVCRRVVMIPGAAGGRAHITAIRNEKPDLFICGEINEWETSEYIRDLRASGLNTALLILGHSLSEEPGSEWLMKWLQPKLPGTGIHHIPSGDAIQIG